MSNAKYAKLQEGRQGRVSGCRGLGTGKQVLDNRGNEDVSESCLTTHDVTVPDL